MRSAVGRGTLVLRPFGGLPLVSSVHSVVNTLRLGVRPCFASCPERLVQVVQNKLSGGKMQTYFAATQITKVLQSQTKSHTAGGNTLLFCPTKTRFRLRGPKTLNRFEMKWPHDQNSASRNLRTVNDLRM
jgi:hypothetical protein